MLMCGRPGPVSGDPPTACYSDVGYELIGEPHRFIVESASEDSEFITDLFYVADFQKPNSIAVDHPRIFGHGRQTVTVKSQTTHALPSRTLPHSTSFMSPKK